MTTQTFIQDGHYSIDNLNHERLERSWNSRMDVSMQIGSVADLRQTQRSTLTASWYQP